MADVLGMKFSSTSLLECRSNEIYYERFHGVTLMSDEVKCFRGYILNYVQHDRDGICMSVSV